MLVQVESEPEMRGHGRISCHNDLSIRGCPEKMRCIVKAMAYEVTKLAETRACRLVALNAADGAFGLWAHVGWQHVLVGCGDRQGLAAALRRPRCADFDHVFFFWAQALEEELYDAADHYGFQYRGCGVCTGIIAKNCHEI